MSLLVEWEKKDEAVVTPTPDQVLGLDYSSPSLYVDSEGDSAAYPRYYRAAEAKLKKAARKFSKRKKGGSNRVETGRLTDEYKYVTFYEETEDYMFEQLDLVYEHYNEDSAFHGTAIHYYDSWLNMK